MDNKKFEQLIELIINENEEQARALFHDIVVEKSRQIYEGLMDEEMGMEGMGNQDQVGSLLDEIDVEENGMREEEEDEFSDIPSDDEESHEVDLDPDAMDDEMGEEGEGDIEDRVVDLEDKLDELMAEFEAMMGNDEEGEEDFGGEEDMMEGEQPEWLKKKKDDKKDDKDDKDDEEDEDDEDDEDKEKVEESVQLQAVKGVTHGDNGVQTKSPTLTKPSINGNGASPANLNKGYQDSGKGGTQGGVLAPTTKDVKGAGSFKNAPGAKFSEKGEAAPKPKFGDDGQNHKSVIESKKTTKKIVR